MENNLALELLHEVKNSTKRWFIAFLVTLVLLFASNMVWLYSWSVPTEETETTIESNDDGNANYINGTGDINNG